MQYDDNDKVVAVIISDWQYNQWYCGSNSGDNVMIVIGNNVVLVIA